MAASQSPPGLRTADHGERSVRLRMTHDTAVEHVTDVFRNVGFSVPTEFSPTPRYRRLTTGDQR
ncbi:MAG: hypothetical protein ABEI77_07670 [Halorientalis sp.]